jgi:4-hydroxy-tetrahydrodipicolinate reductase
MEVRPIRVVQYGLGSSGQNIARLVDATPGLLLVGGIDRNPELVGRDLGDVLNLGRSLNITVSADPEAVLVSAHPDIVVLATMSRLNEVYTQLTTCLRARVNVVSTCEELVYPYVQHPELSNNLHQLACQGGVSVLGIGVNPGFIQDLLPLILTAPCTTVQRILATRAFDASLRRATLHQRVGAGLSSDEFYRHVDTRGMPHAGLLESVQMIAHGIGWQLDQIDERVEPILANDWVHTDLVNVAPGQVIGAHQYATGILHGNEVIVINWQVSLNAEKTYDEIIIEGTPPISLYIDGGVHGGEAAPALVKHAIAPTVAMAPGLHTVLDLPPLHYRLPIHTAL